MTIRTCKITGEEFTVSNAELLYCQQNSIPLPSLSPNERIRRIYAFQNRSHLYHDICKKSGNKIITNIPPEKGYVVYDAKHWEEDDWSALDYGVDYDPNQSFFLQFEKLLKKTPIPNLPGIPSSRENADYCCGVSHARNCYLVMGGQRIEDCYYSQRISRCKNVIDCVVAYESELCYDCVDIVNCYNLKFAEHCSSCSDSSFLSNCNNCSDCFGCVDLQNERYCYRNEKLDRETYLRKISEVNLHSRNELEKERLSFQEFKNSFLLPSQYGHSNENSTGNYLYNTKNCSNCYFTLDSQDLEHCYVTLKGKDSFFICSFGEESELCYQVVSSGYQLYSVKFSADIRKNVRDVEYSMFCAYGVHDCFGCLSLKRQSYCILNRQYEKGDYFNLLNKIKSRMKEDGEYGEFFPPSLSPHYYNHSVSNVLFPSTEAEATSLGFPWKNDLAGDSNSGHALPPDSILDDDDVLNKVYKCRVTGKSFKFIAAEIDFLKKEKIALPDVSPLKRIEDRCRFQRYSSLVQTNS
jgi:hypothetical protein